MEFLSGIVNTYAQFFSWHAFYEVISSPGSWAIIFSLIILEGLLSADNALALAVVVRHLPQNQQKKALIYGIWGAYLFRFVAIGLGVYLVHFTFVKIIGALYLLQMSFKHFFMNNNDDKGEVKSIKANFWRTVLTVELMDIAFSMDSILAAFGVSEKVWVLFIGGMLGILMMRGVAQLFLALLEKYPELESTAFILIALIGGKLMGSAFGFHLDELVFFSLMAAVFVGTIILHHINAPKAEKE